MEHDSRWNGNESSIEARSRNGHHAEWVWRKTHFLFMLQDTKSEGTSSFVIHLSERAGLAVVLRPLLWEFSFVKRHMFGDLFLREGKSLSSRSGMTRGRGEAEVSGCTSSNFTPLDPFRKQNSLSIPNLLALYFLFFCPSILSTFDPFPNSNETVLSCNCQRGVMPAHDERANLLLQMLSKQVRIPKFQ